MSDLGRPRSRQGTYTLAAIVGLSLVGGAETAQATEGYFQNAIGARHKALAGAGIADGRDATAAALNPAGLVHAPSEASLSLSLFSPRRELEGSGPPGFTPTGVVESDSKYFLIPNLALSYRLPPNAFVDVIGVTLYENGGMKTDYPSLARDPAICGGGTGVFCSGPAGIDLQQAFLSVALAKQFGNVAVGVAPILARQQFSADGLTVFGVTNTSTDVAWGYGVRGGAEISISPGVRLAVAGTSRINMREFDKYATFLAEQGDFDIPASAQAGVAVDVTPNLTLMADFRYIWYSTVNAIANPPPTSVFTGADNGPGFGWRDVNVFKLGVEWRKSADLTWRAGYAYNTSPIPEADVVLNILAPQVVQHHLTGGAEYKLGPSWSLEAAVMFAPQGSVTGPPLAGFGNPAHNIELRMYQYEATVGVKYRF